MTIFLVTVRRRDMVLDSLDHKVSLNDWNVKKFRDFIAVCRLRRLRKKSNFGSSVFSIQGSDSKLRMRLLPEMGHISSVDTFALSL